MKPVEEFYGSCRRFPPTVNKSAISVIALYPVVMADGWCGEFKRPTKEKRK